MPLFAAEYGLGVYRLMGRFPRQIVLYGGQAEVRMERERRAPACRAFCGAAAGRVPAHNLSPSAANSAGRSNPQCLR